MTFMYRCRFSNRIDFHKCVSIFIPFLARRCFSSSAVCGHKQEWEMRLKGARSLSNPCNNHTHTTRCTRVEHNMHFWRSPNTHNSPLSLALYYSKFFRFFFVPKAFTCHRAVQWPGVPLHVENVFVVQILYFSSSSIGKQKAISKRKFKNFRFLMLGSKRKWS